MPFTAYTGEIPRLSDPQGFPQAMDTLLPWLISNLTFYASLATLANGASYTAQTSVLESGPSVLQVTGGFGLGGDPPVIGAADVVDASLPLGVSFWEYTTAAGSTGGPAGVTRAALTHHRQAATGYEVQCFDVINSTSAHFPIGASLVRTRSTGAWGAFRAAGLTSGSNGNGSFARFGGSGGSGIQVCWLGGLSVSGSADVTWTYPQAFSVAPVVQAAPYSSAGSLNAVGARTTNRTATSVDVSVLQAAGTRLATAADLFAIGTYAA